MKKNVPQWILDSTTDITQQNNEVGAVVGAYIGAFRKRGFSEKQIGLLMTNAFLLPLDEVERRIDAVLSCDSGDDNVKELCVYTASKGYLFSNEDTDPCEIIELLKTRYGIVAAFESVLNVPELLCYWKSAEVRDTEKYAEEKAKAEALLKEISEIFPIA